MHLWSRRRYCAQMHLGALGADDFAFRRFQHTNFSVCMPSQ